MKDVRELAHLATSVHDGFKQARCSKHIRFDIIGPNGKRTVICSKTASDIRSIKNTRRQLVQACRLVGLEPRKPR